MIISFLSSAYLNVEKLIFIQNGTYTDYYSSFQSEAPVIIIGISQLFFPSFIMYISTLPSKRNTCIAFAIYILNSVPYFIVGARSKLMLPIILFVIYIMIRHYFCNDGQIWIKKKYVFVAVIIIPLLATFLFYQAYTRNGYEADNIKVSNPLVSFVDQQGNTYLTITSATDYFDRIEKDPFLTYTLGPITDKLMYNRISRAIFNTPYFNGQTEETIKYSNNFNFQLSRAMCGDLYYEGHGVGGSFVLDLYYDFGIFGVSIFSFMLGVFLISYYNFLHRGIVFRYFIFIMLSNLFYISRDNALSSLAECFDIYNILFLFGVYFLYIISKKIPGF